MSKTLFDCTLELARILDNVYEGTATGGGTTTIIDTVERTEAADYWNGGTAWITYDAGGAGAAPQGEYGYISDFELSSNTITLRSALTAAVATGDRYALCKKKYPLYLLIQKVNETFGVIEKTDITSLTTATEETEYNLPSDCLELKQVWIQTNTGDTNDNQWDQLFDWDVQKSATGSANVLILKRQFSSGYLLKLVYTTYHQVLRSATDKLDDSLHIRKVIANAAVGCLRWRIKTGENDASLTNMLNFWQAEAEKANQEFAQRLPKKSAKTLHITL